MIHSIMHAQTILLLYTSLEISCTSFSYKVEENLILFMNNNLLKEKEKALVHEIQERQTPCKRLKSKS